MRSGTGWSKAALLGGLARTLVALAAVCTATLAPAVDIVMVYQDKGDNPAADPDGAQLIAMMAHAEAYIEDIFEAPWTHTVYFSYDKDTGFGAHNSLTTSQGKPTSCSITLSPDYGWWFDPTPFDDSEFNLVSTRPDSFTADQLSQWFNGTVPEFLEIQCQGYTNATAPAAAKNNFDAWTVLIHEMGHAMGMTTNVAKVEYPDDDYDYDPDLAWGYTMAANVGDPDKNHNHLLAPSLMRGGEPKGHRKLLTMTDILAIETTCDWGDTTIDLRRQDFYSALPSASFTSGGNWAGNRVPDADDDAYVRHGGEAVLNAAASVGSLLVIDGSSVVVGGYDLSVTRACTMGTAGHTARLDVGNATGGSFSAASLDLGSGSAINLAGAGAIRVGSLTLAAGSTLAGRGTVEVTASLVNHGTIQVTGNGTLRLRGNAAGPVIDLDGTTSASLVQVTGGDLLVEGALTDGFGSRLLVGPGYTATFTEGWTLQSSGTLDLVGTGNAAATVAGGLLTIQGRVNASYNRCRIASDVQFASTSVISLPSTTEVLYLDGATDYRGGTFSGSGRLVQNGPATVTANTTIGVGTFDFDGESNNSTTDVSALLTINASQIDLDPANLYRGTLTIHAPGRLVLNTTNPWTMAGTLNLHNSGTSYPTLLSGRLAHVTGQVHVDGRAAIGSQIDLTGTITLDSAGGGLQLASSATNTIRGGSIVGPGCLWAVGAGLSGYGQIDADVSFAATADLLADGGLLVLGGQLLDVDTLGTKNDSGVLVLDRPWTTSVANTVRLVGGSLEGAAFENNAGLYGYGRIATDALTNTGSLIVDGGPLVLDTEATFAAGGSAQLGADLDVLGAATIESGARFSGAGRLVVDAAGRLALEDAANVGVDVVSAGVLSLGAAAERSTQDVLGHATLAKSLTLADEARLALDLAGASEFDRLAVLGQATLDGVLEVTLLDGFAPEAGTAFEVLAYGSRLGEFDEVLSCGVPLVPVYSATALTLCAPVLGDATLDGQVDAADAAVLAAHWLTPTGARWQDGDFNTDGAVDDLDASILAASWHYTAATAAVPEPALPLLLSPLVLALLMWCRRRR